MAVHCKKLVELATESAENARAKQKTSEATVMIRSPDGHST
jgi:hypothetical protein